MPPTTMRLSGFALLLLTACATSSEVRLIGPDTYTVAAAAGAGTDPVVLEATMKTQATAFCDQSKRKLEVVESTPPKSQFVRDRASMTFRCVPPG